jgi:hypothetical protein
MATLLKPPVRSIYIYRGYIQVKDKMRFIRFDTFNRRIYPYEYYNCIDQHSMEIYTVLGQNILNYHLYNIRPLTKSDPECIQPTI